MLAKIASGVEQITNISGTGILPVILIFGTGQAGSLSHYFFNSCKMSRRNKIRSKLIRAVNEPAELEILVAHHARIRRASGLVFVGEILDDVLLKFRRLVNEVIRDVELVADGARVGDGLRAAAFVLRAVHAILRPELDRGADDIVTLLDQTR